MHYLLRSWEITVSTWVTSMELVHFYQYISMLLLWPFKIEDWKRSVPINTNQKSSCKRNSPFCLNKSPGYICSDHPYIKCFITNFHRSRYYTWEYTNKETLKANHIWHHLFYMLWQKICVMFTSGLMLCVRSTKIVSIWWSMDNVSVELFH